MYEVRKALIANYCDFLVTELGGVRPPIALDRYDKLYREHRFTDIAGDIKRQYDLPVGLRIGYAKKGYDHASAWIRLPELLGLPRYGTQAFADAKVTMYIKKSFVESKPLAMILYAFAHEMAHILLYAKRNILCESEVATDICAMMMGYAEVILEGKQHVTYSAPYILRRFYALVGKAYVSHTFQLGYLSVEEMAFAYEQIKARR